MSKNAFLASARQAGTLLLRAVKHILFHNGWMKLLALLISLVLWAGLISQDDSLTRDKTWQNVNISVTGTDTMQRNGYVVTSDLDALLDNVTVTAAVPQKQYEQAESSAYNLRVDLSRISGLGEQEIKILSTASSTFGRVTGTTPSSVTVEVEEFIVRQRVPVSVQVTGDYQNGWYDNWYMTTPTVDPQLIAVSGPRSLVQTISRARVFLDPDLLEWAEGSLITTGEIRLYDRAGEVVKSPLLEISTEGMSIDTVLIEANVLPTKVYNVTDQIELQGKPAKGYQVISTKISPESIALAARGEVLQQVAELAMDQTVNLTGLTETTVFQLKVQKPSEDAVLSNDTINVTVEIAPEEE
jgi:YbbR domain-containing protein